jgi:antitoxin HicB
MMGRHAMGQNEAVEASEFTYTAVFEPAEEGGHVVTVPALPGVVTEGDTLEEARRMVADAIQCYLERMRKDGLPLPLSNIGLFSLIYQ